MIPSTAGFLDHDFEIEEQPSLTYKMDLENNLILGYADGQEAMRQTIYKILSTERYQYAIYSWDYGIELADLYGEPLTYVCPELERRITEALTWDGRIEGVDSFRFDSKRKGEVHVSFVVHTVFGDVAAGKVVNF